MSATVTTLRPNKTPKASTVVKKSSKAAKDRHKAALNAARQMAAKERRKSEGMQRVNVWLNADSLKALDDYKKLTGAGTEESLNDLISLSKDRVDELKFKQR